jgi:L-alanine-DL-glutamate epimerase-like enolase superfamily enzyme
MEIIGIGVASAAIGQSAGIGAAGASRITGIDVFPVRYPMRGRFKFFEGPDGSPIGRPAVLVRITDDSGASGWGESVPIPKWSDETLETVTRGNAASTSRRYGIGHPGRR